MSMLACSDLPASLRVFSFFVSLTPPFILPFFHSLLSLRGGKCVHPNQGVKRAWLLLA